MNQLIQIRKNNAAVFGVSTIQGIENNFSILMTMSLFILRLSSQN